MANLATIHDQERQWINEHGITPTEDRLTKLGWAATLITAADVIYGAAELVQGRGIVTEAVIAAGGVIATLSAGIGISASRANRTSS